jgi:hypothetical protein
MLTSALIANRREASSCLKLWLAFNWTMKIAAIGEFNKELTHR